jgi:hypothetical protein
MRTTTEAYSRFRWTLIGMRLAYGVVWYTGEFAERGRLVIGSDSLRLFDYGEPDAVLRELRFDDIHALEVRGVADGRTTVVLQARVDERVEIESNVDRWLLSDLFEKMFVHRLIGGPPRDRLLVSIRLRPGGREAALELLHAGPPFALKDAAIAGHDVFVVDDEVLFLFETDEHGDPGKEATRLSDAAMAWRDLVLDIRVADRVYSFGRTKAVSPTHVGLGL